MVVLLVLEVRQGARQEVLQVVLSQGVLRAPVAEVVAGAIRAERLLEGFRKVAPNPPAPVPSAGITCKGNARERRRLANFGILHRAFTTRRVNARRAKIASISIPKPTTIRLDRDQKVPVVVAEERRKKGNKRKQTV